MAFFHAPQRLIGRVGKKPRKALIFNALRPCADDGEHKDGGGWVDHVVTQRVPSSYVL
jgi:hypothetical protein